MQGRSRLAARTAMVLGVTAPGPAIAHHAPSIDLCGRSPVHVHSFLRRAGHDGWYVAVCAQRTGRGHGRV